MQLILNSCLLRTLSAFQLSSVDVNHWLLVPALLLHLVLLLPRNVEQRTLQLFLSLSLSSRRDIAEEVVLLLLLLGVNLFAFASVSQFLHSVPSHQFLQGVLQRPYFLF